MFGWLYRRIARGVLAELDENLPSLIEKHSIVIADEFWKIAQSEEMGVYLAQLRDNFLDATQKKLSGSLGGYQSAISKSMKGLEQDLIQEGVEQSLPPNLQMLSPLIAKYGKKYPFLMNILASGMLTGKGAGSSTSSSEEF